MTIIYNVGCVGQTYILLPEQWPSAHKTNSERISAQCQPSNEDKRKVRKKIWLICQTGSNWSEKVYCQIYICLRQKHCQTLLVKAFPGQICPLYN